MKSLSFRIAEELARRVHEHARAWGAQSDSEVYRRVIEEWVRLQDHPGVRFVDGPAGRRAALVGGADIWEIVDVWRALEFNAAKMIDLYPWLSESVLETARRYYDSYPEEIDRWIERNRRVAEEFDAELDLVVRDRIATPPRGPEGSADS